LGASGREGQGRPHSPERDQADEGRCGRRREDRRRDQGALREDLQGVVMGDASRALAITRRSLLHSSALAASAAFATRVAAAPAAEPITQALIDAAKKEGKLAFYTAMDLPVGEAFAKAFEAKYPGIAVRVERSGAERVFQRIGQEMGSNIHAVDVVNTADGAHIIVW